MGYIIGCTIIYGVLTCLTTSISIIFNKRFEQMIPITILGIMAILYMFGLLKILLFGIYTILFLAVVSLIYICYMLCKYKLEIIKKIITPGFVVFTLFYIITCIVFKGQIVWKWDEYTAWGPMVRTMYVNNSLHNVPDANFLCTNYPPFPAVFEYFLIKIARQGFVEAYMYIAYYIFLFSLLMPMFKKLEWKDYKKTILCFIILLFVPIICMNDYVMTLKLCVDLILGVLFGYILYSYFIGGINKLNILNLSLALFALSLIKETGIIFAGFAIFIMGIDYIFYYRKREKEKVKILVLLIPILTIIIAYISWRISVVPIEQLGYGGVSERIISFLSFKLEPFQNQIINNFYNVMHNTFIFIGRTINVTTMGLIGVSVIGVCIYYWLNKNKENKRVTITFASTMFCFIGYIIFLVLSYLFFFSPFEAAKYPSYERYLSTFIAGIFVLLIGIFIDNISKKNIKSIVKYYMISGIIIILLTDPVILKTLFYKEETIMYQDSEIFNGFAQTIKENTTKESNIWFLSIGDKHLSKSKVIFLTYPHKIPNREWSFNLPDNTKTKDRPLYYSNFEAGLPYMKNDYYTVGYTVDEVKEILYNEFDYVYIYKMRDDFKKNFKEIFEEQDKITGRALYKVIKGEEIEDTMLKRIAR